MRFALMIEPQQGLSYEELLAIVRNAESVGFESFFRSDHYASFPGERGLPTTDAWATLAGLARETNRISLGTLVSPVTFRIPGSFAKVVTTVDEMSGGRVEVGVGAGWHEEEHRQLGIPFPSRAERLDMVEEELAILHGLWTEPDGWSFEGRQWQVRDALFRPRPLQRPGRRHPHLIVGGEGKPRGTRIAARFADEFNLVSARPRLARETFERVREACRDVGREPDELVYSAMTGVLVAASEDELRDRVRDQLALYGGSGGSGDSGADGDRWLAERRDRWIMGTPEQALERIAQFEAAGVQRLMLQDFLPRDLEMVRLIGAEVLPQAS
ncbi:MAG: TIGR03560 family F420-dependent LLM class oxidoreductase [Chloroflexota bacterium]|nr:TIGR03560 family F420-dependent LLM class oxidoreductase [Chloroflexota bacterium]